MFVCVLRTGGIYHAGHVERLQKELDRPLTCLTDARLDISHVTTIELLHNWKGWWSKIELFRLNGPVVYLDLDVSICGDPDELQTEEFTMWADPLWPQFYNSSVMSWGKGKCPSQVYKNFLADPEKPQKTYRRFPKAGDQGFIQDHANTIEPYTDGLILSYRKEFKDKGPRDNTVVVAYHGRPKPWDLK